MKQLLEARLGGVIFTHIGQLDIRVAKRAGASDSSDVRAAYAAYAALIDRRLTTQTLAIALCGSVEKGTPATTLDKLSWRELHVRTYSDEELSDLTSQVEANWQDLGQPQELQVDPYDELDDVPLYQDHAEAQLRSVKTTRTYHTRGGGVSVTIRAARSDGRGLGGNDLPAETSFVPALELFDTVVWTD